jgi:sialate O-acetylesterase
MLRVVQNFRMQWVGALAALLVAATAGSTQGAIELPGIFTDGMVLQAGDAAPVWGTAEPGDKVTVRFAGQTRTARADDAGHWRVAFADLAPSETPRTLTVESGGETEQVEDVLVGVVWLCSGQSNMVWPVARIDKSQQAQAKEKERPALRMFTVKRNRATEPIDTIKGGWQPTTPGNVPGFSATAFFFGRALQRELDVPVGLIVSAWGGTPIRAWTSFSAQQQVPALNPALAARSKSGRHPHDPGALFNAMIHPLVGYGIDGFTWYQGESDTGTSKRAARYDTHLAVMINDWRQRWHDASLPFYFVQLPNYQTNRPGWSVMRQSMLSAHRYVPRTGMAVTLDIGQANNIHPKNKLDVGERLARWALYQRYDQRDLLPSGPLAKTATTRDGRVIVQFDYAQGLTLTKAQTRVFELAGPDGEFVAAKASVRGQTVTVAADAIDEPTFIRYAHQPNAKADLFNGAGLPASPFEMRIK